VSAEEEFPVSYLEKSPTELLASLDVEPDAPSGVDVAAAMATGRRRRRGRTAAAGAAVAALVGGTAIGGTLAFGGASPAPPPSCAAVPLPMGGFTSIDVTGADPTGRYIAGQADPVAGQKSSVVVWHDDEIVDVLRRPGVVLSDFTSRGVGVGYQVDGGQAYLYRDGKLTTLKGERAGAAAVNEAGVIVGRAGDRPARWTSSVAAPAPLPMPPGATGGTAVAVAGDGTIVGWIDDAKGRRSAYLWRTDGTHGPLPLPTIDGRPAFSFKPESIRDGWIYGTMTVQSEAITSRRSMPSAGPDNRLRDAWPINVLPFRYELATGRSERLPRHADVRAAAFYVGDRVVTLPPDPTATEPASYAADSVGDDGRTAAGDGHVVSGGPFRPVGWRCD
jgi:hypothetical protein